MDKDKALNFNERRGEREHARIREGKIIGGKFSGTKSKRTARKLERERILSDPKLIAEKIAEIKAGASPNAIPTWLKDASNEETHAMDKPKPLEEVTDGDLSEVKKDPVWKTWLEKVEDLDELNEIHDKEDEDEEDEATEVEQKGQQVVGGAGIQSLLGLGKHYLEKKEEWDEEEKENDRRAGIRKRKRKKVNLKDIKHDETQPGDPESRESYKSFFQSTKHYLDNERIARQRKNEQRRNENIHGDFTGDPDKMTPTPEQIERKRLRDEKEAMEIARKKTRGRPKKKSYFQSMKDALDASQNTGEFKQWGKTPDKRSGRDPKTGRTKIDYLMDMGVYSPGNQAMGKREPQTSRGQANDATQDRLDRYSGDKYHPRQSGQRDSMDFGKLSQHEHVLLSPSASDTGWAEGKERDVPKHLWDDGKRKVPEGGKRPVEGKPKLGKPAGRTGNEKLIDVMTGNDEAAAESYDKEDERARATRFGQNKRGQLQTGSKAPKTKPSKRPSKDKKPERTYPKKAWERWLEKKEEWDKKEDRKMCPDCGGPMDEHVGSNEHYAKWEKEERKHNERLFDGKNDHVTPAEYYRSNFAPPSPEDRTPEQKKFIKERLEGIISGAVEDKYPPKGVKKPHSKHIIKPSDKAYITKPIPDSKGGRGSFQHCIDANQDKHNPGGWCKQIERKIGKGKDEGEPEEVKISMYEKLRRIKDKLEAHNKARQTKIDKPKDWWDHSKVGRQGDIDQKTGRPWWEVMTEEKERKKKEKKKARRKGKRPPLKGNSAYQKGKLENQDRKGQRLGGKETGEEWKKYWDEHKRIRDEKEAQDEVVEAHVAAQVNKEKKKAECSAVGCKAEGTIPMRVRIDSGEEGNIKVCENCNRKIIESTEGKKDRAGMTDKADYFVEEIRANIIYHNKVFPLLGMIAGQAARGVGDAGKRAGKKLLGDVGAVSQEMLAEEEEEQ